MSKTNKKKLSTWARRALERCLGQKWSHRLSLNSSAEISPAELPEEQGHSVALELPPPSTVQWRKERSHTCRKVKETYYRNHAPHLHGPGIWAIIVCLSSAAVSFFISGPPRVLMFVTETVCFAMLVVWNATDGMMPLMSCLKHPAVGLHSSQLVEPLWKWEFQIQRPSGQPFRKHQTFPKDSE